MKLILPPKAAPVLWGKGDIVVFENKAFLVSDAGATGYIGLVELENGMSWFGNREVTCADLQRTVTKEKNVTAHYPKKSYRMYMEAP